VKSIGVELSNTEMLGASFDGGGGSSGSAVFATFDLLEKERGTGTPANRVAALSAWLVETQPRPDENVDDKLTPARRTVNEVGSLTRSTLHADFWSIFMPET